MSDMTIGKLADKVGVNIETIRYYEREGIIPEPPRNESGYRQYSYEDVTRLEFIKSAKKLGFSLQEISELLSLKINEKTTHLEVKEKAQKKVNIIDKKIRTLQKMKEILQELIASCDNKKTTNQCPILKGIKDKNLDFI